MNVAMLTGRFYAAAACVATIALVAGCGSSNKTKGPAGAGAGGSGTASAQVLAADLGSGSDNAGDPSRSPDGANRGGRLRVVQLEIYQLVVPLGAISRSEEFWKHIDEQQVDVGTYDLLRKNGWRLGTAPSTEWAYFRDILDGHPASAKRFSLDAGVAGGAASMELPMKEAVAYQNIFYFTDENALYGRTFEKCDNLLSVSLQQAPRKAGEARVTVCPTVRSLRKRFEVNVRNNQEREIRYAYPERLYDLNLQADIPTGHFLVIAPSPEVRWKTSLGATFLVEDAAAEQLENVLLLVPRVVTYDEVVPAAPAAADPSRSRPRPAR